VEVERKKELENRRKGAVTKPATTTPSATPGPEIKDGKPVFGSKTVTVTQGPSLFDSHETAETPAATTTTAAAAVGCQSR